MDTKLLTLIDNIPSKEEILKNHFNIDFEEERIRLAKEVIEWLNSPKQYFSEFETFHNSHDELIYTLTNKGYIAYIETKYFEKVSRFNNYKFIVNISNERT